MINPEDAVIVNGLVRQAFMSAQEVMGENGLNAVLRSVGLERYIGNFPPNDTNPGIKTTEYARFNEAIESFWARWQGHAAAHRQGILPIRHTRAGRLDGCGRRGAETHARQGAHQVRAQRTGQRFEEDQPAG